MKSKLRPLGAKFDGKSRVSNDMYRNNWNKIFKKNLEGTVINIEESFISKDFYEETQKEKQELEESYQESVRQTQERKAKERLTGPIDSFSEDLQNSIKKRKEKDGNEKTH